MALLDKLGLGKADASQVAAVIDQEDFEKDSKDGRWQEALAASRAHLDELERTGRNR